MDTKEISQVSQQLLEAYQKSCAIAALTEQYPDITTDDAYQIQTQVTKSRVESGARVVGRKIGLTSQVMMDMLKVHEPDYGPLFDDQMYLDGCKIDRSKMIQPRIEAEIAFLINKDLKGPSCTAFQVLDSTSGILASLEIIDSRISDWKIKIQDTVADNASCWGFVVSPRVFSPLNLDLRVLGLAVYKNGELISTAAGAAVMGNPLESVAWLVNKLAAYGEMLKAGDIILSGSLVGAFPIEKGDRVDAVFDRIGSVSVNID